MKNSNKIKISNILITKNNSEKINTIDVGVSVLINYLLDNLSEKDINNIKRRFHNDETTVNTRTK